MHSKTRKKAAAEATFVFKGTIKKLKASNVKQAAVNDRTAIVTVNQVIEAPPNLTAYAGQDITVEFSSRRKIRAGDELIVHAISWLFGDTIAVRSLFEESESAPTRNVTSPQHQRATQQHFDNADLVVSGRVVEVRLPKPPPRKRATGGPITTKVSEHDPKWREAVIEVKQIHKGDPAKRRVVVCFPSSTDVAWRRAPKLETGQQGLFLLHTAAKSSRTRNSSKSASEAPVYSVRDPHDFQPYSEAEGIKSVIASNQESD